MSDRLEPSELEAILRAAADGDQSAWRRLVDAYSGRVFGLIRAQCGNPDLAEEIAQSTFCTVAQKLATYTETGRFESWLFHIAMNRLRDEMRRRKRHAVSVESETLVGLVGGAEPEDDPGDREDDAARLRTAMAQLSDADQRIVHLRHVAGLSFKQIAELLDEPLGTVLARQHRALKKLKGLLSEPDPASDSSSDAGGDSRRADRESVQ